MKFDADRFKTLRIEHGYHKQAELAVVIGVSQNSVSRWEAGLAEPDPTHLDKICKIFKVKRSDFYQTKNSQEPNFDSFRTIIREEIKDALASENFGNANSNVPADILSLLSRVKDESIWDTIRAVLKPRTRQR